MNQRPTRGPGGSGARKDLVFLGAVVAAFPATYGFIYAACWAAGSRPGMTFRAFLDLKQRWDTFRSDGTLVPWHLVGVPEPTHLIGFWAVLAFEIAITGFVGWKIWLAITLVRRGIEAPGFWTRWVMPSTLPRGSRWADFIDVMQLRIRRPVTGRIALGYKNGALIACTKETSLLVVGPSRSGKTTGVVIPNLLEWEGPAIVTSTKGELVRLTAAHRSTRGPVHVYDPTGELADLYPGITWSPLSGCRDLDHAWKVATWLSAGMQPKNGGGGDTDWAHWAESGKRLVAPLLYVAASTPGRNILDVRRWIDSMNLGEAMSLCASLQDRESVDRAMGMMDSIDQRADKERSTVFSTVQRLFGVYLEKQVAQSAITSLFDADEMLLNRGTLYLCTPAESPERIAGLFVGILMTVVFRAYQLGTRMPGERFKPELLLALDELANVCPVDDLPSIASQGAGRGVILMSIVQDIAQLNTRYGKDKTNTIINNHPAKLVLPGLSDPESAKYLADMIGQTMINDYSRSVNWGQQGAQTSQNVGVRQYQLASPDIIRQLPPGRGILLHRQLPPAMLRQRPWYQSRSLRAMTKGIYTAPVHAIAAAAAATEGARKKYVRKIRLAP